MTRFKHRHWMITAALLAGGACEAPAKRTAPAASPGPTPAEAVRPAPVEAARAPGPPPAQHKPTVVNIEPPTMGMEEPFFTVGPTGWKTLKSGWRALAKREYGEARQAFAAVVSAYPDHNEARFQELRAAVMAGDLAAVPGLWRELLARDFVGFSTRLDRSKEMAPLRASPFWADVQTIRAQLAKRQVSGLDQGLLFVGRAKPESGPELAQAQLDAGPEAKLALEQELYHFDPVTRRVRRLTDSGGQVMALHRDEESQQVMLLLAGTVKQASGQVAFGKARAALLSLQTGQRVGFALDGDVAGVDLCFSDKREPVWSVRGPGQAAGKPFTVEATGTALVAHEAGCPETMAVTTVSPTGLEHRRPVPEGVALSGDGMQLQGVDGERLVRSDQAIRAGSLSWSPGKKRFAYTGVLDRCKATEAIAAGTGKVAPNGVFVWDTEEKKAVRVKAAAVQYETRWLDDTHLAYESRQGGVAPITIHDFSPEGGPFTLDVPATGLYGLPALPCPSSDAQALVH